jgi:hypothetical protein
MRECTMNNTTISHDYLFLAIKKSLNIPKGQSEFVYGQKKKHKRKNNELQNIHIKLKIE